MNHTPLIHSKHAMTLVAIALSCPFAQAGTAGYLSTSSAAGTSVVGPTAVYEGQSPQAAQDSINLRQVSLRQEKTREAMRLLQEGRTAYADGRYKDALDKYQAAWEVIPKAPATQRKQEFIIASIGDASIAVAIEYAKVARYDDAEQLLQDVLLRDPNNRRARHELSMLRDPVRNNPANTPENVRNVQEVQRLLELGYGYYDLGKFDDAYAEANRVLQIDPYNTAARRLQEQCSRRKSIYYTSARDANRAKMLAAVDATWEEALPAEIADMEVSGGSVAVQVSGDQIKNDENLGKIQIANVSLENVTVEEALDFMRGEARKAGVSINFMYMPLKSSAAPAPAPAPSGDDEEDEEAAAAPMPVVATPTTPEIANLTMRDVSAKDLLQMICKLTGCSYRIEDKAIVVYQAGAEQGNIAMRKWKVAPSFFSGGSDEEGSDEDEEEGFAAESRPKGKKLDAIASLKEKGALFSAKGSSARYDRATNTLTVYSTPDDLDMVEEAVNEFRRQMPRMVKVSTKFMEVTQANEEELSFDWVVNPFSVSNNGSTYLGGVSGQNSSPLRTVSDFVTSGGTAFADKYNGDGAWPISGSNNILSSNSDVIGNGLVTGGLRTGTGAISANSMDSLLTAGSAAVSSSKTCAPGILALSGIYDSGSFQAIMRGLSQKKGVDVMSAPSLVLSPGDIEWTPDPDPLASYQNDDDSCAKIEVIRRFIYPTAYDAPEIDSGGGSINNNDNNNNWRSGGVPVASPANPSEWGVEEVGIVMRVRVEDDNAQMDDIIRFKHFEIRVVGFEGFVNYGSPITVGVTAGSRIEHITLTDNRIDMPIFSRRFINSNPKIYDGHTIAIGGLIEDSVQKVEDKVPVFGDLPLVGRFFRSEAESHTRKNLMIFVTAEYIDPTGKPIRHRDTGTGDNPTAGMATPSLFPDEGLANP